MTERMCDDYRTRKGFTSPMSPDGDKHGGRLGPTHFMMGLRYPWILEIVLNDEAYSHRSGGKILRKRTVGSRQVRCGGWQRTLKHVWVWRSFQPQTFGRFEDSQRDSGPYSGIHQLFETHVPWRSTNTTNNHQKQRALSLLEHTHTFQTEWHNRHEFQRQCNWQSPCRPNQRQKQQTKPSCHFQTQVYLPTTPLMQDRQHQRTSAMKCIRSWFSCNNAQRKTLQWLVIILQRHWRQCNFQAQQLLNHWRRRLLLRPPQ
jgi:hypothetical protein